MRRDSNKLFSMTIHCQIDISSYGGYSEGTVKRQTPFRLLSQVLLTGLRGPVGPCLGCGNARMAVGGVAVTALLAVAGAMSLLFGQM